MLSIAQIVNFVFFWATKARFTIKPSFTIPSLVICSALLGKPDHLRALFRTEDL
jgi:hypothetical protein